MDTLALRTYTNPIWPDEGSFIRSIAVSQALEVETKRPTQREEWDGHTAALNTFLAASVAQNSKLEERRLPRSFLNVTTLQSQKFQVGRPEDQSRLAIVGTALLGPTCPLAASYRTFQDSLTNPHSQP